MHSSLARAALLALVALAALHGPATNAATLGVLIDQSTGMAYLENFGAAPIHFVGYSIESPTPTFEPAEWIPITGNYDAAGDGSVDPFGNWIVLSSPSSTTDLTEGVVSGTGGTLTAGQVVSLGAVWTGGSLAVSADYLVGASTLVANVFFRLNAADYNRDMVVDVLDYDVFRTTFGQTIDLRADGNGDGVVNAADYTVWRDWFVPAPVLALPSIGGASVPEPGALWLGLTGSVMWLAVQFRASAKACVSRAVRG